MSRAVPYVRSAAWIALVLVAPLVIMELLNNVAGSDSPLGWRYWAAAGALFAMLWLLPFVFTLLLRISIHDARDPGVTVSRPAWTIRIGALVLTPAVWVAILLDRWPCLIGAATCG